MRIRQMRNAVVAGGFLALWLLMGCNVHLNDSVEIAAGETHNGSINTVNGNIFIGKNATVNGKCRAVNGNIVVQDGAKAEKIQAVNGIIEIGKNCRINGDAESVNGDITCDQGTAILGGVHSVNAVIELRGTSVSENVETISGDITLARGSRIRGSVIVKKNDHGDTSVKSLTIRISDGTIVEGDVRVKNPDMEVKVYIDDTSEVKGKIVGAEVIRS